MRLRCFKASNTANACEKVAREGADASLSPQELHASVLLHEVSMLQAFKNSMQVGWTALAPKSYIVERSMH